MAQFPLKLGIFGVAHMHCWSYVHAFKDSPQVKLVGFYEPDKARREEFASKAQITAYDSVEKLLADCSIAAVCSENAFHKQYAIAAARAKVHVLSEKPIATSEADALEMVKEAKQNGVSLMVAFPCRFSPAYQSLKKRVRAGEIGKVLALRTTNRGRCPFDWFVESDKSGGGAMIDHTVHVADLLFDLLGKEPVQVAAHVGSNTYGQSWEDTAMLTLDYDDGVFATLDSSWSRPQNFKTWGDVTMTVVGETGTISIDLFGQAFEAYLGDRPYSQAGYGTDTDRLMIEEFINAVSGDREPVVTGEHGVAALRVALKGYASLKDRCSA